jgi:hypothetical protein
LFHPVISPDLNHQGKSAKAIFSLQNLPELKWNCLPRFISGPNENSRTEYFVVRFSSSESRFCGSAISGDRQRQQFEIQTFLMAKPIAP